MNTGHVSIMQLLNPPSFVPPVNARKHKLHGDEETPKKINTDFLRQRVTKYGSVMKGKGWLKESQVCGFFGMKQDCCRSQLRKLVSTMHLDRKVDAKGHVLYRWL